MKEHTLVQTHPNLIKILGSKNPLYVMLSTSPLIAIFIAGIEEFSLVFLILGFIYWSFIEYFIHRWVYHANYKGKGLSHILDTFHMYHHRNLKDRRVLNAGPLMVYPMAFIVLLPFSFFLTNSQLFCLGLGTILYYVCYEWIHFLIHYTHYANGYLAYIQKYHFYHHEKAWKKNFGNTLHLWDYFLGTYDPKYKEYELSQNALNSLILPRRNYLSNY